MNYIIYSDLISQIWSSYSVYPRYQQLVNKVCEVGVSIYTEITPWLW